MKTPRPITGHHGLSAAHLRINTHCPRVIRALSAGGSRCQPRTKFLNIPKISSAAGSTATGDSAQLPPHPRLIRVVPRVFSGSKILEKSSRAEPVPTGVTGS